MYTNYIAPLFEPKALKELAVWSMVSFVISAVWYYSTLFYFPDTLPIMAELIGTFIVLICVILTAKENLWCWPTGIVSVVLLGYAFYVYGLYSTTVLHLVYFLPIQFWSWYKWRVVGAAETTDLKVSVMSWDWRFVTLLAIVAGTVMVGTIVGLTDGAVYVYADASILVISIIAQYLLSIKKLESWVLWIAVDIIAPVLYFMSGLYMVAAIYVVFFFIASGGLYGWYKSYKNA